MSERMERERERELLADCGINFHATNYGNKTVSRVAHVLSGIAHHHHHPHARPRSRPRRCPCAGTDRKIIKCL